jgi:hypothetical protein
MFGWADITGWDTDNNSDNLTTLYPTRADGDPPLHISGNPTYDIARARLGGNWRMPTAEEFAFLTEKVADITISQLWSQGSDGGSGLSGSAWSDTPAGITLTSKVLSFTTASIFLPATGYRFGTNVINRGQTGYCWSGTLKSNNLDHAYHLYFSWNWSTDHSYRYIGCALRPVSASLSE